jgi:hypothetical protein
VPGMIKIAAPVARVTLEKAFSNVFQPSRTGRPLSRRRRLLRVAVKRLADEGKRAKRRERRREREELVKEALDPETSASRLYELLPFCPEAVAKNPALDLLAFDHLEIYEAILADLREMGFVGKRAPKKIVSGRMPSIQAAIKAVRPGGTIFLGPGVYEERVVFEGVPGGVEISAYGVIFEKGLTIR